MIYRRLRAEDVPVIQAKHDLQGYHCPILNANTIVAQDDDGDIVALFSINLIPYVYPFWDETIKGQKAAVKLFEKLNNYLKAQGAVDVFVGIPPGLEKVENLATKLGFENYGKQLWMKLLDDVLD